MFENLKTNLVAFLPRIQARNSSTCCLNLRKSVFVQFFMVEVLLSSVILYREGKMINSLSIWIDMKLFRRLFDLPIPGQPAQTPHTTSRVTFLIPRFASMPNTTLQPSATLEPRLLTGTILLSIRIRISKSKPLPIYIRSSPIKEASKGMLQGARFTVLTSPPCFIVTSLSVHPLGSLAFHLLLFEPHHLRENETLV